MTKHKRKLSPLPLPRQRVKLAVLQMELSEARRNIAALLRVHGVNVRPNAPMEKMGEAVDKVIRQSQP